MPVTLISGETATRLTGVRDAWMVSSPWRHWIIRPEAPIEQLDLNDYSHPTKWELLACISYADPVVNSEYPGWVSEVAGDPDGPKFYARQQDALAVMRADTRRIHGVCAEVATPGEDETR